MKTVFACDRCGATFETQQHAIECESSHCRITTLCGTIWGERRALPSVVLLRMDDGTEAIYDLNERCTEARKEHRLKNDGRSWLDVWNGAEGWRRERQIEPEASEAALTPMRHETIDARSLATGELVNVQMNVPVAVDIAGTEPGEPVYWNEKERRYCLLKPKPQVVEAGVDSNHQTDRCDHCGSPKVVDSDGCSDLIATSTHMGPVTLCPTCYRRAGNTVR